MRIISTYPMMFVIDSVNFVRIINKGVGPMSEPKITEEMIVTIKDKLDIQTRWKAFRGTLNDDEVVALKAIIAERNRAIDAIDFVLKETGCECVGDVVEKLKKLEDENKALKICRSKSIVVSAINDMALDVHQNAIEKGWWEGRRSDGELIALIHSEVSEGLEWLRNGNGQSDHIPEFLGIEEEMADVVIRVMDTCEARGWRLGEAIIAKHNFNQTREKKHGGKAF